MSLVRVRILLSMSSSATKSNINESDKATALLLKRGIYQALLDLDLPTVRRRQCWQDLVLLQTSIFALDRYGEDHWRLKESNLTEHWCWIENLSKRLGNQITVQAGLSRIRAYQQIEVDTRFGVPVALKPIESFYGLKCCDVQLMRRVLADIAPKEGHDERNYHALYILDSIEEVEDDLDDLIEDSITFNGNRLLSACRTFGINYALQEYTEYISNILVHYCTDEQILLHASSPEVVAWRRLKETCGRILTRLHDRTTIRMLSGVTPSVSSMLRRRTADIRPSSSHVRYNLTTSTREN